MLYQISLHTLPNVTMMGQVGQRMGYTSHHPCLHEHILIFLREGDMHFLIKNRQYDLTPNAWILLPKGSSYHLSSQSGCMYAFIHFELDLSPQPAEHSLLETPLVQNPTAFPYALPSTGKDHRIFLSSTGTLRGEQDKVWAMLTECDMQRYNLTPSHKLRIDLRFAEMLSLLDERHSHAEQSITPPCSHAFFCIFTSIMPTPSH